MSLHYEFTLKVKKGKIVPVIFLSVHHAMNAYKGSGGIVPRTLDLGTIWRWVFSFTPRSLYLQVKSHWYTLDRRLGGPQSWYGHGGEKFSSLAESRTPDQKYYSQTYSLPRVVTGE
jgi:hypothetical protein